MREKLIWAFVVGVVIGSGLFLLSHLLLHEEPTPNIEERFEARPCSKVVHKDVFVGMGFRQVHAGSACQIIGFKDTITVYYDSVGGRVDWDECWIR